MKRLFIAAIAGLLLLGTATAATFGPYSASLVRVVDGDTFDLRVAIWPHPEYVSVIRVRLVNADTPEMHAAQSCERLLAAAARDSAAAALTSATVIQITDVRPDSLGARFLARVLLDGVDLGERLKAAGQARPWKRDDKTPWCTGENGP